MTYGSVLNTVINNVITASVRAELLFQRTVCVHHRYVIESRITGKFGCFKQQFKIHHVVYNHRTFPAPFRLPAISFHIPALNHLRLFTKTGTKRFCCSDHYLLITGFINQAQAIAKAAINDKTNIVMPSKILCFANSLGIFLGKRKQSSVACQFIQIPYTAGKKAAPPVSVSAIIDTTLIIERHRIQKSAATFNSINFQSNLSVCVFNSFFNPCLFLDSSLGARCGYHKSSTSCKNRVFQFHDIDSLL